MTEQKTVITLLCERAADIDGICDKEGNCTTVAGLKVVKLPCSGMIQPLMIEGAFKAGASGVIVTGCQIGDCYFREGNRMIRERLLGERGPTLKKNVDRRRILALWLSRLQRGKFETEAKEFVAYVKGLEDVKPAAPAAAPKPAPAAAPAAAPKAEEKKEETPAAKAETKEAPAEALTDAKKEEAKAKVEEKVNEPAAAPDVKEAEAKAEAEEKKE